MSNQLGRNPIILDTVAGSEKTGAIEIQTIRWVSKSGAAGDDVIVSDSAGEEIWVDVASGDNYASSNYLNITTNGIQLTTKDSGTIYIYVR